MQGPGIFLAQFIAEESPFNTLESILAWAAAYGYKGVQMPTSNPDIFNLDLAAASQNYCDEVLGKVADAGLQLTELSTHLQGQLLAVHPAYDSLFDGFAPIELRGKPQERTTWAHNQLLAAAKASQNLGLTTHASFSGSFLWPFFYPWPQRPAGLVEEGFKELGKRWQPILNRFDECGVDICYELHPSEDLHDGLTFERFLDATGQHPRVNILYDPSHFVLQQMDYLGFIDIYHERIKAFHVKDAEFHPSPRCGVYGGYASWVERPGRFRSLGDGQVNFKQIFSKFTQYNYQGWAVLEWECCLKNSEDGAKEGAIFITDHMIQRTEKAFDDFASVATDASLNQSVLGLTRD